MLLRNPPGESSIPHLVAQPAVARVPTLKAEMIVARGFIDPILCTALMKLIDKKRRPSAIADDNGDKYFRTSETCDLPEANKAVQALEEKLFRVSGIDPKHGEPVQGQRYAVGQEFKAHTDYFEPSGEGYQEYCKVAGQRTWTFMIYLNNVEGGGSTSFKAVGQEFQPEQGKLLAWNNRRPDKRVNPNTMHHANPVTAGTKYVITKWYREKPWG